MGKNIPLGQGSLFDDEDQPEKPSKASKPDRPPILPNDDPGNRLLRDARKAYADGLNKGTRCECCWRKGKRYERSINSAMARCLIWLVRAYEDQGWKGWCHIKNAPVIQNRPGGGDFAKLKHWDLIEEGSLTEDEKEKKKNSGFWRPTQEAKDFVYGRITEPKYVHLLHNKVEGFSKEHMTIREALGTKFNYAELMGRS